METVIQSKDFALTDPLKQFIQDHAKKSMDACNNHVKQLNIRLKDISGLKGGKDRVCCVEVKLANYPPILVIKRSSDAYLSIRYALSQASRITIRKLGKRRTIKTDHRFLNDFKRRF